jgi:hypothetical protein
MRSLKFSENLSSNYSKDTFVSCKNAALKQLNLFSREKAILKID